MTRTLSSFTPEELDFFEQVALKTHIPGWRLIGCVIEASYDVLSGEESRRLDAWLESVAMSRRAHRVFDRIMAPGMHISKTTPKEST